MQRCIWLLGMLFASPAFATDAELARQLAAQKEEIRQLKAKMAQLEKLVHTQARIIDQLQQKAPSTTETAATPAQPAAEHAPELAVAETESVPMHLGPLHFGGFFDLTAHTRKEHQPKFQFGTFELDMEAHHDPFSINAALDWEGDEVSVDVGVIDIHWFGHRAPPRGPIFYQQAVHLQAGRFDVPFGNDYQFFDAPNRITFTAPLSTELVQAGGFNSDGLRVYGSWGIIDFAGYWVDSLYDSGGTSAGGRLGLGLREARPFRYYKPGRPRMQELSAGFSGIVDWDDEDRLANVVYGVDFNLKQEVWQLRGEWILRDEQQAGIDHDEIAWHLTLIADLEPWLEWPLRPYARYGRWDPAFDTLERDGREIPVRALRRLTVGINALIHRHLALKLEYFTLLGTGHHHPDLPDERGLAQLVVNF